MLSFCLEQIRAMCSNSGTRRAFDMLRDLPKISLENLRPNPGSKRMRRKMGRFSKTRGCGSKGAKARQNFPPVGFESGNIPFHMRFKSQSWYKGHHLKLSYVPLPLQQLQLLIDLGRLRTDVPIDVTQISICGMLRNLLPLEREGGYLLQDEGMDVFSAEINLEVQWATEPIIAAIERAGSTITTAYYDPFSLDAAKDPVAFFNRGKPIMKRLLPPQHLIEYYSDARNRGYLADPDAIAEERFILSQKYGYTLPDLKKSPKYKLLIQRKDPMQIFFGLEPGWIVNLTDKTILKPQNPELKKYYSSL